MAEHGWQYLMQIFNEMELERELDELGSVGWELVTAHWEEFSLGGRSHMQARCILKRPAGEADEFDESDGRFEPLGIG